MKNPDTASNPSPSMNISPSPNPSPSSSLQPYVPILDSDIFYQDLCTTHAIVSDLLEIFTKFRNERQAIWDDHAKRNDLLANNLKKAIESLQGTPGSRTFDVTYGMMIDENREARERLDKGHNQHVMTLKRETVPKILSYIWEHEVVTCIERFDRAIKEMKLF